MGHLHNLFYNNNNLFIHFNRSLDTFYVIFIRLRLLIGGISLSWLTILGLINMFSSNPFTASAITMLTLWTKHIPRWSLESCYKRQFSSVSLAYLCSRGGENPRQQYRLRWRGRRGWCDLPARSPGCSCSGFCPRCWTWTPAAGRWIAVQDYHMCSWAKLRREKRGVRGKGKDS